MAQAQPARSKVLFDVYESAAEAQAHWQCWWAISNEAKPHFVRRMNKFPDFFLMTERAHFDSTFINLGNLFDKRSDASSIEHYFKLAKAAYEPSELKSFRARLAGHVAASSGALIIRNNVIAHKSAGQSEHQVFQAAGIKPRQIRDLIAECARIMNEVLRREEWTERVSISDRFSRATLGVIESIEA